MITSYTTVAVVVAAAAALGRLNPGVAISLHYTSLAACRLLAGFVRENAPAGS